MIDLTPAQAAPRIASLLAARKVRTQLHQANALVRASGFIIKRPR